MTENREHLILECKRIEDDSKYTGETHFQIASSASCKIFFVKAIPAVLSAISGVGLLVGGPEWLAWLAIISSAVFALNSVINPDRECLVHYSAGKHYTTLKHEARSLYKTFQHDLDKNTFAVIVSILRERYNKISELTPGTNNKAFEKARKKIKSGRHNPDFNDESQI